MLVVAKMLSPLHTINTKDKSENMHAYPVHLSTLLVCVSKLITGSSLIHGGSFELLSSLEGTRRARLLSQVGVLRTGLASCQTALLIGNFVDARASPSSASCCKTSFHKIASSQSAADVPFVTCSKRTSCLSGPQPLIDDVVLSFPVCLEKKNFWC
jgi:hypothetical protein